MKRYAGMFLLAVGLLWGGAVNADASPGVPVYEDGVFYQIASPVFVGASYAGKIPC